MASSASGLSGSQAATTAVDAGIGVLNFYGNERTNNANAKQAREQMEFQKMMSDTAIQRRVEDLKSAGLNPALAYGHEASSPGGAMAQMSNSVERGTSSALRARENRAAVKQMEEAAKKTRDERGLIPIQGALMVGNQKLVAAQTEAQSASAAEARARIKQTTEATKLLEAQVPKAQAEAQFYRMLGSWAGAIPGLGAIKNLLRR